MGLVGLLDAMKKADASGLTDREEIVDCLVETLSEENFIPEGQLGDFRITIWREYLRFKDQDFSEFLSAIDVTVRAEPGEPRDAFVGMLRSVMADFELRPIVSFAPPGEDGRNPQLVINDEVIVRGIQSRQNFKASVRRSISDW